MIALFYLTTSEIDTRCVHSLKRAIEERSSRLGD